MSGNSGASSHDCAAAQWLSTSGLDVCRNTRAGNDSSAAACGLAISRLHTSGSAVRGRAAGGNSRDRSCSIGDLGLGDGADSSCNRNCLCNNSLRTGVVGGISGGGVNG